MYAYEFSSLVSYPLSLIVFDRLCCAGHGFSALVTGRRGDEQHTVLFDVGPYADLWMSNAARLGIDLAKIEAIFLSHWHFDHSGALPVVAAAIAAARRSARLAAPLLVDLHPDRPDQRTCDFRYPPATGWMEAVTDSESPH